MSAQPVIFISAVGSELKSARELCGRLLTSFGYRVTWQEHSATQGKDALFLLRPKIESVDMVVSLVGKQYGPEPKQPPENLGRLSYTQYEVKFAQSINRPVLFVRCDKYSEATPPAAPEDPAVVTLQEKFVASLHSQALLLRDAANSDALENILRRLRPELPRLAPKWPMQLAASIVAVGLAIGGWWMWANRAKNSMDGPQDGRLLAAIREFPAFETGQKSLHPGKPTGETRAEAYAHVGKKFDLDSGLLKSLAMFAASLQKNPDKPVLDRARAAYTTGDFSQAEDLYLAAAKAAQSASPARLAEAVDALELAGWSARERMEFARAMEHFRAAAAQTSQQRDPAQWARLQQAIAFVLADQGKPGDAEPLLKGVVTERKRPIGPTNGDPLAGPNNPANTRYELGEFKQVEPKQPEVIATQPLTPGDEDPKALMTRHSLGMTQLANGQYAEAEATLRAVLAARLRVLGPDNTDTLASRTSLATSLQSQGKYPEAERELQNALEVYLRVSGKEHADTLATRHALANVLINSNQAPAGEKELREVIALREKVLTAEHPETVASRNSLVLALGAQGKYPEAEGELRKVIALRERILPKDDPNTIASRLSLADLLIAQSKFADAEPEAFSIYQTCVKALGESHACTFEASWSLARALNGRQKMVDAREFARRAADGARKALGPDNPKTKIYIQFQNEIRPPAALR